MKKLSIRHQHFGWEKNAGYGTKVHIENIHRLGPTIHQKHPEAWFRNDVCNKSP